MVVDLPRVAAILDRARRVDDLAAAAVLPGRSPQVDAGAWPGRTWISREFCRRQKVPASSERSWDANEAERYRGGERDTRPAAPRTRSVPPASGCKRTARLSENFTRTTY